MDLFTIINNFLLTLFPTAPDAQMLAFVRLLSLTSIALLYYAGIRFILWVFNLFGNIIRR